MRSIIQKNSDIYWKPTLAINADPAKLVVDLAEGIKGYRGSDDWINELREKDNVKEDINLYYVLLLSLFQI